MRSLAQPESPALIRYTLWFRGRRILDAVLETLRQPQYDLTKATDVLLTGCSAGGLATYLHTDYVGAHLRKIAPALRRFKAAPDAGFFLMQPNAEGLPVYPDQMREIFLLSNASGGVNAACIAAQTEGQEHLCNFAENNYPHLFT